MTPKEKAKELFDKMKKATTFQYQEYAGSNYSTFEHDKDTIKQCALICVDELICAAPYQNYKETLCIYDNAVQSVEYWNEVKLEIEKL